MKIELMNKTKKQDFLESVSNLGKIKMNELFLHSGKEQIRVFSGNILSDEIMKIWRHFPIEAVGMYFGKEFIDRHGKKESRLSLDGLHKINDQISNAIVDLDLEQVEKWFNGDNIQLAKEQNEFYKKFVDQFVAVRNKKTGDFIGTAKLNSHFILANFLPKERRVQR